eukprot:m51a1_g5417 hypothetical protein (311) ;mRNA; f:125712-126696
MATAQAQQAEPHEDQLWSAWLIRDLIVPRIDASETDTLVALALSFPAALARPCLAHSSERPETARPLALALAGALVTASAEGRCQTVRALARPPFDIACEIEHAAAPYHGAPVRLQSVLRWLCTSVAVGRGHVDVARAVESPEYGWSDCEAENVKAREALWASCMWGLPEGVRVLGSAPFGLTQEDAKAEGARALWSACAGGQIEVVRALTEEPFNLGPGDARAYGNLALRSACMFGHAAILRVLAEAPFYLGAEDARDHEGLEEAARRGHVDVIKALAQPPYSTQSTDALWSRNRGLKNSYNRVSLLYI